jgi:hypothetical protein
MVLRCPMCATAGVAVDLLTVKALLTEQALRRLDATDYRFCADAGCDVVYFGSNGQTFAVSDVRVPVWQKQPFGHRMICCCFDENEAAIREEIERRGKSQAVERVRHHIQAGRCACEVRNPRGSCCLGDVTAAVKRVALAIQASEGTR